MNPTALEESTVPHILRCLVLSTHLPIVYPNTTTAAPYHITAAVNRESSLPRRLQALFPSQSLSFIHRLQLWPYSACHHHSCPVAECDGYFCPHLDQFLSFHHSTSEHTCSSRFSYLISKCWDFPRPSWHPSPGTLSPTKCHGLANLNVDGVPTPISRLHFSPRLQTHRKRLFNTLSSKCPQQNNFLKQ